MLKGWQPAVICAVVLAACQSEFRFDDRDGAARPEAGAAPACPPGGCGWRADDCGPSRCGLECSDGLTCGEKQCGDGCIAECGDRSDCILTTGAHASLLCEAATCDFHIGVGSTAFCAGGSNCKIRCEAACAVTCGAASQCQLQCATEVDAHVFQGMSACP